MENDMLLKNSFKLLITLILSLFAVSTFAISPGAGQAQIRNNTQQMQQNKQQMQQMQEMVKQQKAQKQKAMQNQRQ
jgi:hypothetical protein